MTTKTTQAALSAANDTPGEDRVTAALHGLAALLGRAHARELAQQVPANSTGAPTSVSRGGGQ